jgi:phage terminase large subunit
MAAVRAMMWATEGRERIVLCGREFMNLLADSSFAEVKAAIASEPWLAAFFDVAETYIRTKSRQIYFVFAGFRHNLDSIKSKAKILLLWVDEAEPVSSNAWTVTIPTVREEGRNLGDVESGPQEERNPYPLPRAGAGRLENHWAEWRDNPFFPKILNAMRLDGEPSGNTIGVWNGGVRTVVEGAYYSKLLLLAKEQ